MNNKFFKIFKIFFFSKISLSKPQKKKILLYDGENSKLAEKVLGRNFQVLHTRYEKFYLNILIKTFFKHGFKSNYLKYFDEFKKFVNPKIIITFNDNSINFFNFDKNGTFSIALQNGHRTYHNDILEIFKNLKKKFTISRYFVFNSSTAKHMKKYVKADYVVSGSVENNLHKINYNKERNDIIYISGLSIDSYKKFYKKGNSTGAFFKKEINFIKNFYLFCKNKNINFKVLGKFKKNRFQNIEKDFYKKIEPSINFIKNHKNRDNYRIIDKARLLIGFNSSLCYQSLGRGKKVFLLSFRLNKYPFTTKRFGFFDNLPKSGPFWDNSYDFTKINNKISNLYYLDKKKWKKILKKYKSSCCAYNFKNLNLKRSIEKLL